MSTASLGPKLHLKISRIVCVNMAQSSDKISFDQLSERLKAVTSKENDGQSLETIMKMTFDELKEEKIDFGTAHKGRRYAEMTQENRYLTWFTQTFKDSRKPSHVKFLRFIQLHVENLEKNHKTEKPKKENTPVAKSKMMPPELPEAEDVPSSEEESFEAWEAIHAVNQPNLEMMQMQDRMQQMESLLHQVVEHLSQGQNRINPSSA